MKILHNKYKELISADNLLGAWSEFIKGKKSKKDIQKFSLGLMDNIFELNRSLSDYTYRHGGYQEFNINDPKPRNIHKATVRDRLLHHAIHRKLYPAFDRFFIADSYSCRIGKGVHKAVKRFEFFSKIISRNNSRTCWILKCDIKKFFDSIDHKILIYILAQKIMDKKILWLLNETIGSFDRAKTQLTLFERERERERE